MKKNKKDTGAMFNEYKELIKQRNVESLNEQIEKLFKSNLLDRVYKSYSVLTYALDYNEGGIDEIITSILSYNVNVDLLIDDVTPLISLDKNDVQSIKSLYYHMLI